MSDLIVRVPCVACGRWFAVDARASGWACPECRPAVQAQGESTRESNPNPSSRRIDAQE